MLDQKLVTLAIHGQMIVGMMDPADIDALGRAPDSQIGATVELKDPARIEMQSVPMQGRVGGLVPAHMTSMAILPVPSITIHKSAVSFFNVAPEQTSRVVQLYADTLKAARETTKLQ